MLKPEAFLTIGSHIQMRAWRYDGGRTDLFRSAAHPDVEIALFDEGATRYRVGSHELRGDPAALAIVPRGIEHRNAFEGALRGTAICISDAMVGEVTAAMGARGKTLAFGLVKSARALALAKLLVDEAHRDDDGRVLAGEAIAEALVVELVRTTSERTASGARDPRVRIALDKMRASYAEDISVDDLAKAAGMSRFHFSRLFRDEVGEAPYKHLLKLRVARAAELLRGGRHSVTEAALAVGFRDLSRFSRAFRRELGTNPNQARRARAAKNGARSA
jgi:AraC family transcriptional regulator